MNHPASTLKFDFPSLEIRSKFINVFIYEFKSLKQVVFQPIISIVFNESLLPFKSIKR